MSRRNDAGNRERKVTESQLNRPILPHQVTTLAKLVFIILCRAVKPSSLKTCAKFY